MAANDPGSVSLGALTKKTTGDVVDFSQGEVFETTDQFIDKYETTKQELWAYYCYYIGDNGLTLFNFAPTAFQNLVYAAAGEEETLRFLGRNRPVNSIVLLCNGISFAIQILVFLVLGSFADFGTWRPNILIGLSIIAFGIGFGWLGVHTQEDWHIGVGLYIIGLIAYQATITFWTAAFPGLARNTKEMRAKARELADRSITREEYDFVDMMKRNEISNTAFYIQSVVEVFVLAIIVGIMFSLHVNDSAENNNWGLSVLIAFATGFWVLCSVPWFVLEKRRPGQNPGANIVLAGLKQLRFAVTQIWQLRQSLAYLIGYFLLGDSLNTTVTVISTLQNEIVAFNSLQLTYLLIVGIVAQAIGIGSFWRIQKRYKLSTKTMFMAIAGSIVLLDAWGLIGIWTQVFGFHRRWEAYQAFYGLLVCPWYSYSQTMISEVTPQGKEFLFFSLFSIIGKTSAFIGPLISSAIIDETGNNSSPFYFLFPLSVASCVWLYYFVDVEKSKIEQQVFLEKEKSLKSSQEVGGGVMI